jgi:hypothetical protein
MSIPGVGPSIAGQVAQEVTVSLCGRFVNLFQNRLAAGTALTVSSVVGIIGGFYGGVMLMLASRPLLEKMFPKVEVHGRLKGSPAYKLSKLVVAFSVWAAIFITLNVIVSKCLKLPFSRLASAGISIVGGALGAAAFAHAERNDSSFTQSIKSYLNEFAKKH